MKALVLFFAGLLLSYAQVTPNSKTIYGKITADFNDLESIHVINLKTEQATLTEKGGNFSIKANVGDTLLFTAVHFKSLKKAISKDDFNKNVLEVKLETLIIMLDEVKINEYKNINAVSLGIISPNTKRYTPAERKLRAAEKFHWYSPLLIPLGGFSVDGMINAISGKTKQLKKEVEVERKELLLTKIDAMYDEKYFTQTLKIPPDYVGGFQYYVIEDAKFVEALKAKNKTMATFIMNELAVIYKDLIAVKP